MLINFVYKLIYEMPLQKTTTLKYTYFRGGGDIFLGSDTFSPCENLPLKAANKRYFLLTLPIISANRYIHKAI